MATVINTSDDILKLLAENAEFYQAARRLILTDELIGLPERFARFAADVHDFIIRQEQFNERVDNFIEEQRQFNEEQRQFHHRIEAAIGELKGNTARYVVGVLFDEIAEHLGFTFRDTLSRKQLRQLIGPPRHSDVSREDRHSFIRTDLVIIADDAAGNTQYVAVEASYTGDARDTARARRNAELLQRFTGCPAHAVVASVHNDPDIQAEIDGGEVHWYALHLDDFTPE